MKELDLLYDVMVQYYRMTFRYADSQCRDVTDKKEMFAYIARLQLGASLSEISRYMRWKSHASAIHAISNIGGYIEYYSGFKRQFNDIIDEYEFRNAVGLLFDLQ